MFSHKQMKKNARKGRDETKRPRTKRKKAGWPWASGQIQAKPWSNCHSARLNPKGHSLRIFTALNRITKIQPTEAPKTQQNEKRTKRGHAEKRRKERGKHRKGLERREALTSSINSSFSWIIFLSARPITQRTTLRKRVTLLAACARTMAHVPMCNKGLFK